MAPCPHGKTHKRFCRECGGTAFCQHNHVRKTCRQCRLIGTGGGSLCEHLRRPFRCKDCRGSGSCMHSHRKAHCSKCGSSSRFCAHGRDRRDCSACHPLKAFQRCRADAKKRGFVFTLTSEQYKEVTSLPCLY